MPSAAQSRRPQFGLRPAFEAGTISGMKIACIAALALAAPMFAQGPIGAPGDEAAIRTLVQHYMDARDRQDPRAIESLFTPDADQLVSSGEWRKGRPEVVKGTMASSQSSAGKRTITVESVRVVSPGVALVDGHYDLTGLAGGETRHMWTSLVAVKTSSGWKIAAIRNMLPAVPVPAK
jgi:uncharacterized protein (TIGR02246 family)